jgi:hypothetical protein
MEWIVGAPDIGQQRLSELAGVSLCSRNVGNLTPTQA